MTESDDDGKRDKDSHKTHGKRCAFVFCVFLRANLQKKVSVLARARDPKWLE